MTKALISVSGADTTGIIARIATKLYEMNINILDISQTILSGCFTMMMVVDLTACGLTFTEVQEALQPVGKSLGMESHIRQNAQCQSSKK